MKQLSVFLENEPGRLLKMTEILGKNKVNIRAITIAETESFGVARMVVDNEAAAEKVLKDAGLVCQATEVIAVEIPDVPGGLAGILKTFEKAETNIEYMYGFMEHRTDKAIMIFRFRDTAKARELLTAAGITLYEKEL